MRCILITIFILTSFGSTIQAELTQERLLRRIQVATRHIAGVIQDQKGPELRDLMDRAQAIVVLRQYRGGCLFGACVGKGLVMAKDPDTGRWGSPGFVESYEGSCGLQFGGAKVDSLLFIMNKAALKSLTENRFQLGGDMAVVNASNNAELKTKRTLNAAVVSYSRARGQHASLSLSAGYLSQDEEANQKFYGEDVNLEMVIHNRDPATSAAFDELMRVLNGTGH